MKAAIYARTKTIKQFNKSESVEKLMCKIESYCAENNLTVKKRYTDIGEGQGYDPSGFNLVLNDLENGNLKVNILVIATTDKYTNTLMKAAELVQRLRAKKIQLKFISSDEEI